LIHDNRKEQNFDLRNKVRYFGAKLLQFQE